MLDTLIVEDHDDARRWLKDLVHEAFPESEVVEAATLAQANDRLKGRTVSLAVIDINLPDGSGIELVRTLSEHSPQTYTVIATIYDDDDHLFAALQAGAQGYLLKEQPHARLLEQLRGIMRDEPPLSPAVARRILRHFQTEATGNQDEAALSEREREVLTLVAKGLSRSDISELLGITANTAAGYIKAIYRKLNISSRAEAVLEAVRMGLVNTNRQ